MRLSGITTERELVDQALREFIAFRRRMDVRELRGVGGLQPGYDYRSLRAAVDCGTFLQ